MAELLLQKKILLQEVYNKAKQKSFENSFSGVCKDLEVVLRDEYKISLSYKTFENYYKSIVTNHEDYTIKKIILNDLSVYLGYEDFEDFVRSNYHKDTSNPQSAIRISVSKAGETEETFYDRISSIVVNITNSPIFSMPEFITKHKNEFGIIGLFLVAGFVYKEYETKKNKADSVLNIAGIPATIVEDTEKNKEGQNIFVLQPQFPQKGNPENVEPIIERKKECMYWNGDHYVPVFCDEKISGAEIIALDKEKLRLFKKILRRDTLNAKNAIRKVWYDKSNKNVEFFTHYGIHPTNGKTLKPITEHILETYAK